MNRILVTGATGFLGSHLVRALGERGKAVRAFCRQPSDDLRRLGVEVVRGDVRDRSAVTQACVGIDLVFHTAAVPGIWGSRKQFYETNTVGTLNVLEGCRQAGVPRLVFTSSPSVTFDGQPQENVDEHAPYPSEWLCHYPETKALAEQAVLQANSENLRTCALRPHLIWGPGDRHLIPRLLQRAKSGRLRRVGDGSNLIDTVHIDNAVEAHLLAAERLMPGSPVCGSAYFITQGEPVNCWDWINELLTCAGLQPVRRSISFPAAWRIGHFLEFLYQNLRISREPPMTRFLAGQLALSHYFDISAAKRELAYEPRVSTAEGMRRLVPELRRLAAGNRAGDHLL